MSVPRWRRSPATLWRRTVAGVVLLPEHSSDPVQLMGGAALVWDLLEDPTTETEATDLLARACAVEPDRVRADVGAVLERLAGLGAVAAETPGTC